jgi:DNA repair protein RecO
VNQRRTHAIVLTRTDYGEADRILTVLTPNAGKLSLMAKGARKIKSKLAGGIELFSTSEIVYIPGKGSVATLISSRLIHHYGRIVRDISRTMLGYELIKLLHSVTEDEPESDYYGLLESTFSVLNDESISVDFIRMWFSAQLLRLAGHTPNMQTDTSGAKLDADEKYEFDYDATAFRARQDGTFDAKTIKFLRLVFGASLPHATARIDDSERLARHIAPLVQTLRQLHLRA